jgi:hypothetical protein
LFARLAALPLPGTLDVTLWQNWTYNAVRYGPATLYGSARTPDDRRLLEYRGRFATVDYPPLALYELALAGKICERIDPGFIDARALTVSIKALPVVAEGLLTALLRFGVPALGGSLIAARWAALAWWLNPAAIVNGAVLGYLDPLFLLPLVGAFVAAFKRRWWLVGGLGAVAVWTKAQALIAAPALVAIVTTGGGTMAVGAAAGGAAIVTVVVLLPIALADALPNLAVALASLARHDMLSGNAANVWWVVTYVTRAYYDIPDYGVLGAYARPVDRILAISTWTDVLGFLNPRPLGTALVAVALAWTVWRVRRARHPAVWALAMAFTVHAYFLLATQVHENHQVAALPFLAIAAALWPDARRLFYAVSAIVLLNLNLFYGFGEGVGFAIPRGVLPPDASVWLALANTAALAWHARLVRAATH